MAKEDPVELYCSLHLSNRHLYRVYAGACETTSPGVVEATMEHRMRILVRLIQIGDTCRWAVVLGWQGPERITGPPKDDLSGGRNFVKSVMAKDRLIVILTKGIASWKQGHNEPLTFII